MVFWLFVTEQLEELINDYLASRKRISCKCIMRLVTKYKIYIRRFTSTVPARGARALNRAISNSCL